MAQPLPKHRAREYETIFILNPELALDAIEQMAGRVTDVITRLDGKLLRAENWGKRRLAYHVKKQSHGYYLYLRYLGYSDLVHEIERNFRMMEPVLKYLTVKIEEDVDPAARPVNEAEISFIPMVEDEPEHERESIEERDDDGHEDDFDDHGFDEDETKDEVVDDDASDIEKDDRVEKKPKTSNEMSAGDDAGTKTEDVDDSSDDEAGDDSSPDEDGGDGDGEEKE